MNSSRVSIIPLMALAVIVLLMLNLLFGSVAIPIRDILQVLFGGTAQNPSWQYIILESRLPQALTAILAGSALAVSGLMLQTAFANALAGPDVFGINSGAGVGVALVMLGMGGGAVATGGYAAIIIAAFLGAMTVTAIIFAVSTMVKDHVMLLIIGLMTGYLAGSIISLLNYFATESGVKNYMLWGMGNFGGVSLDDMPLLAILIIIGLLLSFLLVKPLNTLLLGAGYARSLGINIKRIRGYLLLLTGLLTAVVTAFCGPITFIGLAVPHIARLIIQSDDHRLLIPMTALSGSALALLCLLISTLPSNGTIIPINAVTPLFGAPVIIYVILRKS
ncbi:MAG: iron ABC transporter permease [Prevotella sp.]|nr:iron ABC transporter permease [Prevotella sp.]